MVGSLGWKSFMEVASIQFHSNVEMSMVYSSILGRLVVLVARKLTRYVHIYNIHSTSFNIKLEVSKEFLVCIVGFYGPVKGSDSFKALRSITFYKNKAKYGPYGVEIGHAFTSSVAPGKVVGFHGRSGVYLDAIGVHMEYF
ncbi:hypothetical protein ACB092_05G279700 [Castanea dentata]